MDVLPPFGPHYDRPGAGQEAKTALPESPNIFPPMEYNVLY